MLIVFDLEGMLVDAELFPEIGSRLGCEQALTDLTLRAMGGSIDFREAIMRRARPGRGAQVVYLEGGTTQVTCGQEEESRARMYKTRLNERAKKGVLSVQRSD